MREIKFRAWDRVEQKIIFGIGIGHGNYVLDFNGKIYNMENGRAEDFKFILMQYIGLKDKNGKEIYEGDIVKDVSHSMLDYKNVITTIEFFEGTFREGYFGNPISWCKHCEVIGNIYETPELLEAK